MQRENRDQKVTTKWDSNQIEIKLKEIVKQGKKNKTRRIFSNKKVIYKPVYVQSKITNEL